MSRYALCKSLIVECILYSVFCIPLGPSLLVAITAQKMHYDCRQLTQAAEGWQLVTVASYYPRWYCHHCAHRQLGPLLLVAEQQAGQGALRWAQ